MPPVRVSLPKRIPHDFEPFCSETNAPSPSAILLDILLGLRPKLI